MIKVKLENLKKLGFIINHDTTLLRVHILYLIDITFVDYILPNRINLKNIH